MRTFRTRPVSCGFLATALCVGWAATSAAQSSSPAQQPAPFKPALPLSTPGPVGPISSVPPPPDVRAPDAARGSPPAALARARPRDAEEAKMVEEIDRIIVEGVVDPAEKRRREKAGLTRMREALDRLDSRPGLTAREYLSVDGARRAELNTVGGGIYCLETRPGQINWSGMGSSLSRGPGASGIDSSTGALTTKPVQGRCP